MAQGRAAFGAYFWAILKFAGEIPGGEDLILDGGTVEDGDRPIRPWLEDLMERLGMLEDLSRVSLEDFASAFGLPEGRAEVWRGGGIPTTHEVWAMALWASQVPGGSAVLLAPYPGVWPVRK